MPTIHTLLNTFHSATSEDTSYDIRSQENKIGREEPLFIKYDNTSFGNMVHSTPRHTIEKFIGHINSQISFARVTNISATEESLQISIGSDTVTLSFSEEEMKQEESLWIECAEIPDLGEVQAMSLTYNPSKDRCTIEHIDVSCSSLSDLQQLMKSVEDTRQTQRKRLRIGGFEDSIYTKFIEESVICEEIDLFSHTSLPQLTHSRTKVQMYLYGEEDIQVSIADIYELSQTNRFNT